MQPADKQIFTDLQFFHTRKWTSSKFPKPNAGVPNPVYTQYVKYFALQITLKINHVLHQNQQLKHSCASACKTTTTQTQPHQISKTQKRTENKTTDVVIQQHSRKLLTY